MKLLPLCLAHALLISFVRAELYVSNQSLPVLSEKALFRRADEDYTCSADRECSNGACCGESNVCGYGPTYCGDGCQSNCDAKAECGRYAEVPGTTCPLNVCCSEFGFCGTTDDFCGLNCQSNCGSPDRPNGGGDVRDRIIGYYESWADTKDPCGQMTAEQIPVDGLTHVNFAFAYIDPDSGDIIPMDDGEGTSLFQRVTNIKLRKPDLKVWVSIGGWTFNNAGKYQSVFGDIARSTVQSSAFADKVIAFCGKYGFDGVDLDWEYPGADDRGGKEDDSENFSNMLRIMRRSFDRSSRPLGISITVPTSYWYLRWFDLPGLSESVDWFNLMAYDLHGVWDREDPIGPYVYAHTNLTEIDVALDLFWRNNISPSLINLGLGFYGRSFELETPLCSEPGCKFSGPSSKGRCTQEAGILSYREIREIIKGVSQYSHVYDEEAAVNYMTWGRQQGNYWISYDDSRSFQAKIDFANERGLAGLFIWAIDQDDDALDALQAVTGRTIENQPALSDTQGEFDMSKCYITECGGKCKKDETTMVHTNLDRNGKGCDGSDHAQRAFCCPSASAPDPSTCTWRGSGPFCSDGFCKEDTEVSMLTDDYGGKGGSGCWFGGRKSWCCPSTYGQDAVAKCSFDWSGTCSDPDKPQELTKVLFADAAGGGSGPGVIKRSNEPLCCPAEPKFKNCKWHGADGSCDGNRCPAGQVMVTHTSGAHDGPGEGGAGCSLNRWQVFCCDPLADGSTFLPVPLENLFPDASTFEDSWVPSFDEAIDQTSGQMPHHDPVTTDPNEESFAWVVIVGPEEDVQSFDKRDGSHLELYDCPTTDEDDYSVQSLKAVCTSDGPESNCEDITKGGVKGTVIRLPEGCGKSRYVRAVSFRETTNTTTMPSHLRKRHLSSSKVYELHYDWNFQRLRRDAGKIHFRADFSNHPGYWDEVVAADNDAPAKRHAGNWRELDKRWVKANEPESWYKRFLSLLTTKDVGLVKTYNWKQNLYDQTFYCSDNTAAYLRADAAGDLQTTMDFGQTIIGTLNDFVFTQAFAFFRQSDFKAHITAGLQAHARVRTQTTLKSLDGIGLQSFGSNFNIKGILRVNPYFDVRAQIQGEAVASLQGTVDVTVSSPMFHYMFPQELESIPTMPLDPFKITTKHSNLNSPRKLGADIGGIITLSVVPVLGITVEVDYRETRQSKIEAAFNGAVRFKLSASASTDCVGSVLGVDVGFKGDLNVTGASFLGWDDGSYPLVNKFSSPIQNTCVPWNGGISKRGLQENSPLTLGRRASDDAGPLFPDTHGSGVYCPTDSSQGGCHLLDDELPEDPDDYDDGGEGYLARRGTKELVKRDGPKMFCADNQNLPIVGFSGQRIPIPKHPPARKLLAAKPDVDTYQPLHPDDCLSFEMAKVDTPSEVPTRNGRSTISTEHVWEVQISKHFLNYLAVKYSHPDPKAKLPPNPKGQTYDDPRVTRANKGTKLSWCQYSFVWWTKSARDDGAGASALLKAVDWLPTNGRPETYDDAILTDQAVNNAKNFFFNSGVVQYNNRIRPWEEQGKWGEIYSAARINLLAYNYMAMSDISTSFARQSCKFERALRDVQEGWLDKYIATQTDYVAANSVYNPKMDDTYANEYHEWMRDVMIVKTEAKARKFVQETAEKIWKNNRDRTVQPLPNGHRHGTDDDMIKQAQAIYDATRDGTLAEWNIEFIDDLDNCDGDGMDIDDSDGDGMDVDDEDGDGMDVDDEDGDDSMDSD